MMRSIRFIMAYIFEEKAFLFFGILMTSMVSALTWLGPKIIAYIIDQGLVPHDSRIALIGVVYLAFSEGGRLLSVFLSQMVYAILGQNVIENVREKMVTHLMKLPISYFDQVSSGKMMTRVVSDVNSLTDFFQSGFVSVLGNLASIIAIFVGLWSLNFKLGTILFISFIPVSIACVFFSSKLRLVYEHMRNQLSSLNAMLADFLFGMRTIRSLGISGPKYRELNGQIEKYADSQKQMVRTFALFQPTLSLGIGILILILIAMGLPLVEDQVMKVGEWVAALSYVVSLQQPLTEISDRWNFFLAGITSIERITNVFDEKIEKVGSQTPTKMETIRFQDVGFQYLNSNAKALIEVDLEIKRGDWIGIYGASGSGKSTLLQMIYGFYLPTEGVLRWNGEDYYALNLKQLRSHFGVVEQFPFLFTGTIRENITLFGEHPMNVDLLRQGFSGFPLIENLLMQLDFEINERGNNLSMGQKQMIAFLRAYLARPDIWILDEATAFFDDEAEQEVIRALTRLGSTITVIQVAHRPEALSTMHRLIQVTQSRVQEQSSPKDSK
jgi:ATP-binding cassette subfamily B multidrug efflux pump